MLAERQTPLPLVRWLSVPELNEDFFVLWEAADFALGKEPPSVGVDVEGADGAAHQFGFDAELRLDLVRQTDGARAVVSPFAVFDADLHAV